MYFTINIPYRKIIFQLRMEEAVIDNCKVNPFRAAHRESLNRLVERELCSSREKFFLMPH